MKWYLIFYVCFSQGGDPGIVQGYRCPERMVQIETPSREVCEQLKEANRFMNMECWGKPT